MHTDDDEPPSVNRILEKIHVEDGPFLEARLRIAGYIRNAFLRGAHFVIWDPRRFSRRTERKIPGFTSRPLTEKHVSRVWTVFRELCDDYEFELIRIGRSFRWKISKPGREGTPGLQIRNRLIGYAAAAVRRNGRATIDRGFVAAFAAAAGVDLEAAWLEARKIRRIDGLLVAQKGANLNFRVKISPPHGQEGSSSATQRKEEYQTTRARRDLENRNRTSLRSEPGDLRSQNFAVEGRWISASRLLGLACWLAKSPLRHAHWETCRVRWRFPHARNLAFNALRRGHGARAILGAYEAGLVKSHTQACDRGENTLREPSACVAYAWAGLESDGLPVGERWRAFFSTDPAEKDRRQDLVRAKSEAVKPQSNMNYAKHRAARPENPSVKEAAARLLEIIQRKGLSAKEFLALQPEMRRAYLRRAERELTENQKGPI